VVAVYVGGRAWESRLVIPYTSPMDWTLLTVEARLQDNDLDNKKAHLYVNVGPPTVRSCMQLYEPSKGMDGDLNLPLFLPALPKRKAPL
jgi:hypothetical protein